MRTYRRYKDVRTSEGTNRVLLRGAGRFTLPSGRYSVRLRVRDAHGNAALAGKATFRIR
jgi:hypothetical protein